MNRYRSLENSEKTDSTSPKSSTNNTALEQSLEFDVLDEENIRFDDNDDDADIEYLDENFNEPLSSCAGNTVQKTEFNIELLKERPDILDSFVMKPKQETQPTGDNIDSEMCGHADDLNSIVADNDGANENSQQEEMTEENSVSQDYYENYEYHCQGDQESCEDDFYGEYILDCTKKSLNI